MPAKLEEVGMSDNTFILVATYPNEAAAQDDYQVVKDAHAPMAERRRSKLLAFLADPTRG